MKEENEIIEQIRRTRKAIEKEYDYDLEKIFSSYKTRQEQRPQEYFSGKPVRIRKSKAA